MHVSYNESILAVSPLKKQPSNYKYFFREFAGVKAELVARLDSYYEQMYSAGGQQGGGEDESAENSETEENMDTEEGVAEVSAHHYIYINLFVTSKNETTNSPITRI